MKLLIALTLFLFTIVLALPPAGSFAGGKTATTINNASSGGAASDYTNGLVTWFYAPDLTNANGTTISNWTCRADGKLATYVQGDAYKEPNLINSKVGLASTNLPANAVGFTAPDVTNFTVMWCGKVISAASEGGLFNHRVVGGNGFGLPGDTGGAYQPHLCVMNSGGEIHNRKGTVFSAPTATILITWTWDSVAGTANLYTNGVADTSIAAGDSGYGINSAEIGRSYNTAVMHTGEIRVYGSVLSSGNRALAETAMKSTWGIP